MSHRAVALGTFLPVMFVFVQKKKSMRENKPLVGYSLKWKFEFSMQSLRRGTFIFKKQKTKQVTPSEKYKY